MVLPALATIANLAGHSALQDKVVKRFLPSVLEHVKRGPSSGSFKLAVEVLHRLCECSPDARQGTLGDDGIIGTFATVLKESPPSTARTVSRMLSFCLAKHKRFSEENPAEDCTFATATLWKNIEDNATMRLPALLNRSRQAMRTLLAAVRFLPSLA